VPVPEPKSKIRDQVLVAEGFTQAETVKSSRLLTIPVGSETYSPLPDSRTAFASLPGARGPVAPELVIAEIVRVSVLGPVPIRTCCPGARPEVLRTLIELSPAPAGAASPDVARPSR
jgi:hypothetical protein